MSNISLNTLIRNRLFRYGHRIYGGAGRPPFYGKRVGSDSASFRLANNVSRGTVGTVFANIYVTKTSARYWA